MNQADERAYMILRQKYEEEKKLKEKKDSSLNQKHLFLSSQDEMIRFLVNIFGNNWATIANYIPGKTNRQCRERYNTYLAPGINHKEWTPEEDALIIEKYKEMGHKWVSMSQYFAGRTANSIKNRFNAHIAPKMKSLEKKIIKQKKQKPQVPQVKVEKNEKDTASTDPFNTFLFNEFLRQGEDDFLMIDEAF